MRLASAFRFLVIPFILLIPLLVTPSSISYASSAPSGAKQPNKDLLSLLLSNDAKVYYNGHLFRWNTEREGGIWCRSTDTKGDKNPHIEDYFDAKRLVKRILDRNGDNRQDEIFDYSIPGKITRRFDNDYDGTFKTEQTSFIEGKYVVRITKAIKGKKHPKWHVVAFERFSVLQADEDEAPDQSLHNALKEVNGLRGVVSPFEKLSELDDKFVSTSYGFKIEKTCLDAYPKLGEVFHKTLSQGVACLWKLGESDKDATEAKIHVAKIGTLLDNDPRPRLVCSLPDNEVWGKRDGVSATSPADPWVGLNPEFLQSSSVRKVQQNLFHEIFHPLGFEHENSVDYPYACSYCCFPDETKDAADVAKREKIVKLACDICKTSYTGVSDYHYLDKMAEFLPLIRKSHHGLKPLLRFIKEYKGQEAVLPEIRRIQLALVKAFGATFEIPVGIELANRFKPQNDKEKAVLREIYKYSSRSWPKEYASQAKAFADGMGQWVDGDLDAAAQTIAGIKYPDAKVLEPKFQAFAPHIEMSFDRSRLRLAELIYDAYRTDGADEKAKQFDEKVIQPLSAQIGAW